jgi:hypothetical protein
MDRHPRKSDDSAILRRFGDTASPLRLTVPEFSGPASEAGSLSGA